MLFDHRVSIFSHSDPLTRMHEIKGHTQKGRIDTVWKALGTGLLFLFLAFFASTASAADVTLAWDSNNESDLEGYGVYFSQEDAGPAYNLFGYVTLSEFSDPSNPTFTVTGLEEGGRYYFTVTAFDGTGNESGFSDPVCADVGDVTTPCASANIGSGSSDGGASGGGGSGGGGGGGCFIGASTTRRGPSSPLVNIMVASLGAAGALLWIAKRYFKPFLLPSTYRIRNPK